MTFIEFTLRRLLGGPIAAGPNWMCPNCGSEKLHLWLMGDNSKQTKDRVNCWSCRWADDVAGLWKKLNPHKYYRDALAVLAKWQVEWEVEEKARAQARPPRKAPTGDKNATSGTHGRAGPTVFSSVGSVRGGKRSDRVMQDFADLDWNGIKQLVLACDQLCHLAKQTTHIADLATYCREYVQWLVATEEQHLAECRDTDCDAAICRRRRGLPPLYPENWSMMNRVIRELVAAGGILPRAG
jgi:hypothetical protein